jgi:hypothetical protein
VTSFCLLGILVEFNLNPVHDRLQGTRLMRMSATMVAAAFSLASTRRATTAIPPMRSPLVSDCQT